jgi:hypothetical protein
VSAEAAGHDWPAFSFPVDLSEASCGMPLRRLMMVMRTALGTSLVLTWALAASVASANDTTFGGAGTDLVPLTETRVRMVSEDIKLRYVPNASLGSWKVTAHYVFENETDTPATTVVGFPEYRCLYPERDCAGTSFVGLQTEVNGVSVTHRQGRITKKHKWEPVLGVVWLYDVTFPAKQRVDVTHTYSLSSGFDVYGNHDVEYVTRTGALWAGSIGHASFTFILPPETHSLFVPDGVSRENIKLVGPESDAPHVEVTLQHSDWTPTDDLGLSFNNSLMVAMERLGADALARSGLRAEDLCPPGGEAERPAQEQMCLNDAYALRGFPFRRSALHSYYYGNPYDWRREPVPWYPETRWYARGLRPFPNRAEWGGSTALDPGLTTPNVEAMPSNSGEPVSLAATKPVATVPASRQPQEPKLAAPALPRASRACGLALMGGFSPSDATLLLVLVLTRRRRR